MSVAPRAARSSDRPLSLGPASRLLGVDPDTLRRWADEGKIDAFTTAGGHRRFSPETLERVLRARRRDATARLASLGATADRVSRAYRRSYCGATADGGGLRGAVRTEDRDAFRDDGRALVSALVRHIDADDAAERAAAEHEAAAITETLGRRLAAGGTPLADAVSLFVAARRPFLAELGRICRRRTVDPDRLGALYDAATSLLDRLLLRLVAAHQEVAV